MLAKLETDLHNLHTLAVLKLKSEDIDLLEAEELQALFRCRDLSERLANALRVVGVAFYSDKIIV